MLTNSDSCCDYSYSRMESSRLMQHQTIRTFAASDCVRCVRQVLSLVLCAAAVSGLRLTCQPRSLCQRPFLRRSGRPLHCDASRDIILCRETAVFRRQPADTGTTTDTTLTSDTTDTTLTTADTTDTTDTTTDTTLTTVDTTDTTGPAVTADTLLAVRQDSPEPELEFRDSPVDLQNLQGRSNLGQRFGSRVQSQAQQRARELQALAGQGSLGRRDSFSAGPQTVIRGGFLRGLL